MKKLLYLIIFMLPGSIMVAQNSPDSLAKETAKANADDPSQFLTRVEVFHELYRYDNDVWVNQTVLRAILKLGKRFTTRIDLPYGHNSAITPAHYKQSGIGDISFRLLGYKLNENPRAAITVSMEVSLNTAASPILGTGKNLLVPLVTYSRIVPKEKLVLSLSLQHVITVSGDKTRENISFSKLQGILIRYFSKKSWMVVSPEWYLDYMHGGLSMNFRSRFAFTPAPRINVWVTSGAGIFGDFAGRYKWTADIGGRYFLFRESDFRKKKKG